MNNIEKLRQTLKRIKNLKDINAKTIESIICNHGLKKDNRKLYGQYQIFENSLPNIGTYQRPNQLTQYVRFLLTQNINSHLDIGTNSSDTYLIVREFLKKITNNIHCKTIDILQHFSEEYKKEFNLNYEKCDITKITESFESVFIDGSHVYEDVKKDFNYCLKNNVSIIAFHDIDDKYCPDVVRFWREVKNTYNSRFNIYEIKDKDNIMGIGILKKKLSKIKFL